MSSPTIRPTGVRSLLVAAAVGAGVAWLVVQVFSFSGISLPQPGPSAWVPPLIMAVVTGWLAWTTHRALTQELRLVPEVAVSRLRIAKAGMLVASTLIGGYLVLLAVSLGGWPAPMAQSRSLHALLAVATSLAWAVAGFVLERVCRIPIDPQAEGGEAV